MRTAASRMLIGLLRSRADPVHVDQFALGEAAQVGARNDVAVLDLRVPHVVFIQCAAATGVSLRRQGGCAAVRAVPFIRLAASMKGV